MGHALSLLFMLLVLNSRASAPKPERPGRSLGFPCNECSGLEPRERRAPAAPVTHAFAETTTRRLPEPARLPWPEHKLRSWPLKHNNKKLSFSLKKPLGVFPQTENHAKKITLFSLFIPTPPPSTLKEWRKNIHTSHNRTHMCTVPQVIAPLLGANRLTAHRRTFCEEW